MHNICYRHQEGENASFLTVAVPLYVAQKVLTDKKSADFIISFHQNSQKFQKLQNKLLEYPINPVFSVPVNQRADLIRIASVIAYGMQKGNEWVLEKISPALLSKKLVADTLSFCQFILEEVYASARAGNARYGETCLFSSVTGNSAEYMNAKTDEWAYIYLNSKHLFDSPSREETFLENAYDHMRKIGEGYWVIADESSVDNIFANVFVDKKSKMIRETEFDIIRTIRRDDSYKNSDKKFYVDPFQLYDYILAKTGLHPFQFASNMSICKNDIIESLESVSFAINKLCCVSEYQKNVIPSTKCFENIADQISSSVLQNKERNESKEADKMVPAVNSADSAEVLTSYAMAICVKLVAKKYQSDIISYVKQELLQGTQSVKKSTVQKVSHNVGAWEVEKKALLEKISQLEKAKSEQWEQLISAKNRESAIQARYEKLHQEKKALELDNEALQAMIPVESIEDEIDEKMDDLLEDVLDIDYHSFLTSFFKKNRVIIVGGHNNIITKFTAEFPGVTTIPLKRIASCDAAIKNADVVLFKPDYINHSFYNKVKSIATRFGIPYGYINNSSSVEYMAKSVYLSILKIQNKT